MRYVLGNFRCKQVLSGVMVGDANLQTAKQSAMRESGISHRRSYMVTTHAARFSPPVFLQSIYRNFSALLCHAKTLFAILERAPTQQIEI